MDGEEVACEIVVSLGVTGEFRLGFGSLSSLITVPSCVLDSSVESYSLSLRIP